MENFEFEITRATKKRAKRRRIRNERKWLGLRIFSTISLLIGIGSGIAGIFFVPHEKIMLVDTLGFIFAGFLMLGLCSWAILVNMASHWIDSRLVERIWIKDGKMYHFIQVSCGAGANSFSVDDSAFLYIIDLDSIFNARYDSKSGRIEFEASGTGVHYANYKRNIIDETWDLAGGFVEELYDYTKPSMYEYLKSIGVNFKEETINFKVVDNSV